MRAYKGFNPDLTCRGKQYAVGETYTATGYRGAASATGDQGAASATGDQGAASATGKHSVAVAAGYACSAKGARGCVLFLVERDAYTGEITHHKSVKVGGKSGGKIIRPNVAYKLADGKVVEA